MSASAVLACSPSSDPIACRLLTTALPVPDFSNPRAQRYAVNRSPQVTSAWPNWVGQEPGPNHGNIKH